ncbi:peptidase inhibitor 16-like [Lytechinus variegatus]|uniref:peptidase inhibitor 16-like n=1 Tax=Lytechinus variegatus TaxID=7654 RepID=UPI001BB12B60|nr:peptidase inhibitor 16-like [Lytechinus variegatus]
MEANFSTMNTTMPNYGFKILAFAVATVFAIFALNSTFIRISYNKKSLDHVGVHQESEWSGKQELHSKHKDFLKNGREKRAITTPGTPHVFTAAEQQNLVDWHNDYRRQVSPEASNMEYMTWNDELATWAQEWTDSCYYEHGFPAAADNEKIGQNLWRGFVASLPDGSGPLSSWWDEWQWYDYETNTCLPDKICGHYTQLVWDTSYQVGCGRSFCAEGYDDTLNFTNNYIVACNYREQGNVQGIKPYESGTSCTRCTSGIMTCDDKLCRQCQAGETEAGMFSCKHLTSFDV